MKAAVISLGSKSSKMVVHALKNYFDEVDHISLKEIEYSVGGKEKSHLLYKGQPMPHYDCVYIKGSFRYAMLLKSITQSFDPKKTFYPNDAESFITVNDKSLSHLELEKSNIPMPKTYIVSTVESGKSVLDKLKYPIIIKLSQGTHGKGVMVADTIGGAKGVLDTLAALNQPFLIQEFVDAGGEDIRCLVAGNKVLGAMKRKAGKDDIRSNLHSGGSAEVYDAPENMKKIAIKAAKQLGTGICGVDILETPQGGVVIEGNVSPGLQGITEATGKDIPDMIAKYLYEETTKLLDGQEKQTATDVIKDHIHVISEEKPSEDLSAENLVNNPQDIICDLDFRANRILLPELVTKLTGFDQYSEYTIKANKGKLEINKLG